MGINASPTTSHANEPTPSTTSTTIYSRGPPSPITLQRPQRRASATPQASASANGRKRTRGRTATSISVSVEDTDDSTVSSSQDHGHVAGERFEYVSVEPDDVYVSAHSAPESSTHRESNVLEPEGQIREDVILIDNKPNAQTMPSSAGRKRKRSESVSVAAITRGQLDDPSEDGLSAIGRENGLGELLTDGVGQTHSEPQTPAPSSMAPLARQQKQDGGSGPANPKTEGSMNGTNGRKPKPRNFDKVVFGRWLIKTWCVRAIFRHPAP